MASEPNDTRPSTDLPQHAGVKRTRTPEPLPPRKSARLESLYQEKPALAEKPNHNSDVPDTDRCTQQLHEPLSRKRSRTEDERTSLQEGSDQYRKRRRTPAKASTLIPPSREDDEHPISYWVVNQRWPRTFFEKGDDMQGILARKRSMSERSRKNSDTGHATPSSTDQGEPKSREQKSAEYRQPQYATVLATKGVFMEESELDISHSSKRECECLLQPGTGGRISEHSLFRTDLFRATCKKIQDRNEARVIQDITRLIVPSAETLNTYGATHLRPLIESVNEGWSNCISITKTRPQPDYAVGFRREAFKQEQLDRMHPIIGDFNDRSYFMATWYMYFPFLICEVKCGAAALDIADRQNAHSAAIAVRAVVELFRLVKREEELQREVLAFSVSHDHATVRIYGYYAEMDGAETKYYRHTIRKFDFTDSEGKEKWTAYQFTKNVYDNWMPMHFRRICSAIDQIPPDISFSMSQSELNFSEPFGLSQDLSRYSIAQSSAGSISAQAQGDMQSSVASDPAATPSTSIEGGGGVFKKPRKDLGQRGRR